MSFRRFHTKWRWLLGLGGVAVLGGAAFTLGLANQFLPLSVQSTSVNARLPRIRVRLVSPASPAQAAVEWFVPTLAGGTTFERLVAKALVENRSRGMGTRAIETREKLTFLRNELVSQGLPDVWLGIPYVESRMHPEIISSQCAGGAWQFLARTAQREGLRVERCGVQSEVGRTQPEEKLDIDGDPVEEVRAAVTNGRGCRRARCALDERLDFEKSSRAALRHLRRLTQLSAIDKSPDRVPLGILAFNMGYGGAKRVMAAANGRDPFRFVATCTSKSCEAMREESAWYVPRVVATAALVACNGADAGRPELSDWARSGLCSLLHEAKLAPATVEASAAVSAVAEQHDEGWKVGLTALRSENDSLTAGARRLDAWLLRTLTSMPGVEGIAGAPGESPEELILRGAEDVLTGTVGVIGPVGGNEPQLWLRLERWDVQKPSFSEMAFAAIDPALLDSRSAENLLADALLLPVRDRSGEAIRQIVQANAEVLRQCIRVVSPDPDPPALVLTLRLDEVARVTGIDVRGESGFDAQAQCVKDSLSKLRFPQELAGRKATLTVDMEASNVERPMERR